TLIVANDVAAMTWSLLSSRSDNRAVVRDGKADKTAPCLMLAPGTGLGMAGLVGGTHVVASEGGHSSAAPSPALAPEVIAALWGKGAAPSWEDLLCGAGIRMIAAALGHRFATPEDVTTAAARGDGRALATITVYCRLLGACAGDLVLIYG